MQVTHLMVITCVHREPRVSAGGHISRLGHASSFYMYKFCVLEMVRLGWQAAHEDHVQDVVTDPPSDSLVVVTGPHEYAWPQFNVC